VRTAERLRRLGFASVDQLTGVGMGSLRWLTAGLSPLRVDHGWLSAQACPAPSTGDANRGPLDHIGGCPVVGSSSGGTGAVPVAERPPRGDMAAALDPKWVWQPAPTDTRSASWASDRHQGRGPSERASPSARQVLGRL